MTSPVTDLKPLTAVSWWLAQRHAQDQELVANNLIQSLYPLWDIMRYDNLDASTLKYVKAALPEVERSFLQSQRLSAVFNANVRFAELPVDDPLVIDFPEVQRPSGVRAASFRMPVVNARGVEQARVALDQFDKADVAKTITIEANYMTKRAMPGPEDEVMRNASVRVAGASVREAMNGARGVTNNVVKRDKKIKGFARVTDGDPCPLCALLAARGAVFGKGSFIGSDKRWEPHPDVARDVPEGWSNIAKVHDNCRCMLRPVYAYEGSRDAASQYWHKLWSDKVYKKVDSRLSSRAKKRAEISLWREVFNESKAFDQNQFDMAILRRELRDRELGLLDSGLAPVAPQVRWAADMQNQLVA